MEGKKQYSEQQNHCESSKSDEIECNVDEIYNQILKNISQNEENILKNNELNEKNNNLYTPKISNIFKQDSEDTVANPNQPKLNTGKLISKIAGFENKNAETNFTEMIKNTFLSITKELPKFDKFSHLDSKQLDTKVGAVETILKSVLDLAMKVVDELDDQMEQKNIIKTKTGKIYKRII